MDLTYRGAWAEYPGTARALTIGDYTAHVYLPAGTVEWSWRVRWVKLADLGAADIKGYEEIARATAGDDESARAAAWATILEHHRQRFAQ